MASTTTPNPAPVLKPHNQYLDTDDQIQIFLNEESVGIYPYPMLHIFSLHAYRETHQQRLDLPPIISRDAAIELMDCMRRACEKADHAGNVPPIEPDSSTSFPVIVEMLAAARALEVHREKENLEITLLRRIEGLDQPDLGPVDVEEVKAVWEHLGGAGKWVAPRVAKTMVKHLAGEMGAETMGDWDAIECYMENNPDLQAVFGAEVRRQNLDLVGGTREVLAEEVRGGVSLGSGEVVPKDSQTEEPLESSEAVVGMAEGEESPRTRHPAPFELERWDDPSTWLS